MNHSPDNELIRVEGLSKSFGMIQALSDVNFSLSSGEILGLAGHNGAGKSVLVKVMAGIYRPDSGKIFYENEEVKLYGIEDAQNWGYHIVPQELSLARQLSVAENLFLGREEFTKKTGIVDQKYIEKTSKKLLEEYFAIDVDPRTAVEDLDTVTQRIVQVVRCLREGAKVIVFDETTAGLAQHEREELFKHIRNLSSQGLGIIFISHMISELLQMCDSILTLRGGLVVGENRIDELNENKIVELIVGKEFEHTSYEKSVPSKEIMFSLKNATADNGNLTDISFDVHKGEILGIYGLRNQGQGLLLDIISGEYNRAKADITLDGKKLLRKSSTELVKEGISFLPERGHRTVFAGKTIVENMVVQLSTFKDKGFFIRHSNEKTYAEEQVSIYGIQGYSSLNKRLNSLSGGNMQKVLLARTMMMFPKILMLFEPVQGIDIGAKTEIKKLILDVAREGHSVIIVTAEIDDIIDICNRTVIIREGRLKAIFNATESNKTEIVKCSTN